MSFLVQQGAWEATQNSWKYGNEAGLVGAAIEDSAARLTQQIEQSNRQVAGAIDSLTAQIHSGLAGIEASLDHGFSEVLAAVGIMQETLEELVRLAANPAKTAAYEHFVEAREAFQNGWYPECQEQLTKAMEGVEGVSSGYKMEWRFHYLKGLLYMGSNDNADHEAMADLALAEASFLLAAKYAVKEPPSTGYLELKEEPEIQLNQLYMGVVKRTTDFGAFVEIFPGTDGLIHISHLAHERVDRVTDVVSEGDECLVRVIEINDRGQVRLSLFKWENFLTIKEDLLGEFSTRLPKAPTQHSYISKSFIAASRIAENLGGKEGINRALSHSEKALLNGPKYGEGHFQKARLYVQLDEIEAAIKHMLKAGEQTPVYYAKIIAEPSFSNQKTAIDAALKSVRAEVVKELAKKVKKLISNYQSEINKYSLENHPTIQRWMQLSEEPTSLGLIEVCGYRDLGLHADKLAFFDALQIGEQNKQQEKLEAQKKLHLHQTDELSPQTANCFPIATRILTPTGHREIGDIAPGDTVLSTNASGQLVHATVTAKKTYGSSPITRIVLDGETRDLRTTAHHSFKTDAGWKRASQLQAGDTVLRVDDSGESRLVRIETITTEAPEPVFNLHTTGPHNFIAEGVLAHNFTELRWLRTWAHRLVVDPFHSGVVEGVEASAFKPILHKGSVG